MADHQDIMKLAQKGALAQKQERYRDLLAEIGGLCQTLQVSALMMLPGNLDDIKEDLIDLAARKLKQLLPEARQLKKDLEKEGVCPLF